jgi:hypothetical protein
MVKKAVGMFLAAVFAVSPLLTLSAAHAADIGTFDPFVVDDLSAPGTVTTVKDPTGASPTPTVYSFKIPPGYCNPKPYDVSGSESDCTQKSTRSQIREDVAATPTNGKAQPKESWYGWYVYFPNTFAFGTKQTKGNYEFAYWHNNQCPHLTIRNNAGQDDGLYLQTNRALGNYDCEPGKRIKLADFKDLAGKWTRFEVFVRWAGGNAGMAQVYLNGKLATEYVGPTLTAGFENINYFKFGIYLCCTEDVAKIKGSNLYFAGVKRAPTRAGLAPEG